MIITIIIHFVGANKFFRIGFFDVVRIEANKFKICSHHRDQLRIYWRGRRGTCQVPPEISTHKSAKKKRRSLCFERTFFCDQEAN